MAVDLDTPQLNKEQEKAVIWDKGPLLVIAGAGTGKTTVITEKITRLLLHKKVAPESILALTFTEKASAEMEERVDKSVPYGYSRVSISTFHGFADTLLRQEGHHIGLNSSYRLLTQADTLMLLRKNLFDLPLKQYRPLGNPNKFIEALQQHFSRLQDEDVTVAQYETWTKKQKKILSKEEYERQEEITETFKVYQIIKQKNDAVDFGDLLPLLLKLFRERPEVLRKYQKRFQYILIDEFQDTNIAQYECIKLLCPAKKNPHLTVVGDDSQAIYKFRGASISNILKFTSDYQKAQTITLITNYRSYQSILDRAYMLIQNNNPDTLESKLGISKELIASRKDAKESVQVKLTDSVEKEAEFVASTIQKLVKNGTYSYQDCAILVRAHAHSLPFINALLRRGIPYQIIGSAALFKQPEVKDLIAYMQFLTDLNDSASWYRVLSMNIFAIDPIDIHALTAYARSISRSLYETCMIVTSLQHNEWMKPAYEIYGKTAPILKDTTIEKLVKLIDTTRRHFALSSKETAGQILYFFLEDTGYLKQLAAYKTEQEEKTASTISQFFELLKTWETVQQDASVFTAIDYIRMAMDLGESPMSKTRDLVKQDAVPILSVHAAKGLEYPVVFIVNMSNSRFPSRNRPDTLPIPDALIQEVLPEGDYHLQEERRLCYVAVTRGRDKVFLTASRYYHEGKRLQKVSPFLIEMFPETWKSWEIRKTEEHQQMRIFEKINETPVVAKTSPKQPDHIRVSYSQIETFQICPKRYSYQYIVRIPTPSTSTISFGTSVHKALQLFYKEYINDSSLTQSKLLELYEQAWIPYGYSSMTHEKKTFIEGKEMLTGFYKTFHTKLAHPVSLEQPFTLNLPGGSSVTGIIDRIDQRGNTIELIDYKTGRLPSETDLRKDKQLLLYGYAATHLSLLPIKPKKVILTYYYLAEQKKISTTKTEAELKSILPYLLENILDILQSKFVPIKGIWCKFCPFRINCEAWQ